MHVTRLFQEQNSKHMSGRLKSISDACLPAKASCLMKKFILDLRLFKYKVISTALFPKTIVAKSIHNTVNCSVCKENEEMEIQKTPD